MMSKKTLLRWTTGALSVGGAFFLAACYGPQRPPQRPISTRILTGTVLLDGQPVEGVAVCEASMPDECPMTDVSGRFQLRFEDDGAPRRVCTKNALADAVVKYSTECVEVGARATEISISVQKLEQ